MYRSKITRQGRVTIPKALRNRLGWREGDAVVFDQENGRLILQTPPKKSLSEVLAQAPGLEAKVPYSSFKKLLELENGVLESTAKSPKLITKITARRR